MVALALPTRCDEAARPERGRSAAPAGDASDRLIVAGAALAS
jgi:hypothetical protein